MIEPEAQPQEAPERIWIDAVNCLDDRASGVYYMGKPSIASVEYARVHPVDEGRVEVIRWRAEIDGYRKLTLKDGDTTLALVQARADVLELLSLLSQLSSSEPLLKDGGAEDGQPETVCWWTRRAPGAGYAQSCGRETGYSSGVRTCDGCGRRIVYSDLATAPTESSERCADCGHNNVNEGGVCVEMVLGPEPSVGMICCFCKCVFPASTEPADEKLVQHVATARAGAIREAVQTIETVYASQPTKTKLLGVKVLVAALEELKDGDLNASTAPEKA